MKPIGNGIIDVDALRSTYVINATDDMGVERAGEHRAGVYNYVDIIITGEPKVSELQYILQDERRIAAIKADSWEGTEGVVHRDLGLRFHIKNRAVISEDFCKYISNLDDRILEVSFATGYNLTRGCNCQFFILLANITVEALGVGRMITNYENGTPYLDKAFVNKLTPVKSESTVGHETLLAFNCKPEYVFSELEPIKHLVDYTRFDEVMMALINGSQLKPFVLDKSSDDVQGYLSHNKVPSVALSASVLSRVIGEFVHLRDCFSLFASKDFEPTEESTTIKTLLLGGIDVTYKTTKMYDGSLVVIIIDIK